MPPLTQGIDHTAASGRVVDPTNLTPTQLAGLACVLCEKHHPRTHVGTFPNGEAALACDDHDIFDLLEVSA